MLRKVWDNIFTTLITKHGLVIPAYDQFTTWTEKLLCTKPIRYSYKAYIHMVSSCRKIRQVSFFASGGSFIMENLGRGTLYEGTLFFSHRGRVIWGLTVHSDLKEHLPVVSFVYSCHIMLTHNNTSLNFNCFFGSLFCQKKKEHFRYV